MRRSLPRLYLVLVVAALLPLGGQVESACCAGWISPHGGHCCDASAAEAGARACCEGDLAPEGAASGDHHQLVIVAVPLAAATSAREPLPQSSCPVAPPATRAADLELFVLHSALLI
jgi:hypothetical protein